MHNYSSIPGRPERAKPVEIDDIVRELRCGNEDEFWDDDLWDLVHKDIPFLFSLGYILSKPPDGVV